MKTTTPTHLEKLDQHKMPKQAWIDSPTLSFLLRAITGLTFLRQFANKCGKSSSVGGILTQSILGTITEYDV